MRVLVGHNEYQSFGGEDAVAAAEQRLLMDQGHEVYSYRRSNQELADMSAREKTRFIWYLAWADKSYKELRKIIQEFKPDVVHFHNIYFMMSPAVYHACKDEGVPVVQSLHNFRPLCANGLFFRADQVCEKCLHGSLLNGVRHRCYQKSLVISALVVRMLKTHRKMNTWRDKVDAYITATEFTRKKYIQAGFNADQIYVKPNFIYPEPSTLAVDGNYALYVGRLSPEKGLEVLIQAWKDNSMLPLKIVGDGPSKQYLSGYIQNNGISNVELLGHLGDEEYDELMRNAKCVIIPSTCYENFPRVAAEAMSYGLPVIASRLGSLQEIIDDRVNGCLFDVGDAEDLKKSLKWLITQADISQIKANALKSYNENFKSDHNYATLLKIYAQAIHHQQGVSA